MTSVVTTANIANQTVDKKVVARIVADVIRNYGKQSEKLSDAVFQAINYAEETNNCNYIKKLMQEIARKGNRGLGEARRIKSYVMEVGPFTIDKDFHCKFKAKARKKGETVNLAYAKDNPYHAWGKDPADTPDCTYIDNIVKC